MEVVVMIIMAMVSFSYLLKLTCHGRTGRIVESALAAAALLLTYDLAASQSKTQIADWLSRAALMLDVSVLLTVDVAFQICFCVMAAKALTSTLSRREKLLLEICLWVPGILIFPTLFALLTELMFTFTGVDFALIAWISAGALLILLPLLAEGLKRLVPEADIRLEMIFMVNLIIAALGVIATVNGRTAAAGSSEIEWGALAAVLLILVGGLLSGLVAYRYSTYKKTKKQL